MNFRRMRPLPLASFVYGAKSSNYAYYWCCWCNLANIDWSTLGIPGNMFSGSNYYSYWDSLWLRLAFCLAGVWIHVCGVLVISGSHKVHCRLQSHRVRILERLQLIDFRVLNSFKEGNQVADKLANPAFDIGWWPSVHPWIFWFSWQGQELYDSNGFIRVCFGF